MPARTTVISIGECMVELSRGSDGRFGLAYGGDTFNTAVYLARAGVDVAYASALGDDPYSDAIIASAQAEGVGTRLIRRLAGRMPGLYLIETTSGERTFHYWRDRAPARELFDGPDDALQAAMMEARLLYLSGITLSLYAREGLDRLERVLTAARAADVRIAVDPNYRPRGWGGDKARAQETLARFYRLANIALPTFDDEQDLWGDATPDATIERLSALGVQEIVVKRGGDGADVWLRGESEHVPCPVRLQPVDTTAAGDSFNAAYLARGLLGEPPTQAALFGHQLAAIVIQHRGAIVPRTATAALLDHDV